MTQQGNKSGYGARQSARTREKMTRLLRWIILGVLAAVVVGLAIFGIVRAVSGSPEPDDPSATPRPTPLSHEEAQALLDARYEKALGSAIDLTYGENSWHLLLSDVAKRDDAPSPTQTPDPDATGAPDETAAPDEDIDLTVRLACDRPALERFVQSIKEEIDTAPVNATMSVVEVAKFAYTDSADGLELDAGALVNQLEQMVEKGEGGSIELQPAVIEPDVTRAELEGCTVLLGECYTSLQESSTSRTSNVNLALSFFNFKTIAPGRRVSFNRVVGHRTKENGFKSAPEYAGTTIQTGVGGGTCQASTTIYGAVIRAGLEISERHPHTMTVGYVPGSQDAAVSDGDKDLRFRNTTDSTIYIFAYVDTNKNRAVCKIYGKPIDPNVYIDIESNVLQTDIGSTSIVYMDDVSGKQVWYVDDPPVLYKKGKAGMRTEAYRVYHDVNTGAEVRRERLSTDFYQPESDTYLRGVHER